MNKSNKKKKWIKYRHRLVRNILYLILYPYSRLKYGIIVERFKDQGKRQYLILLNHQTPFDQFFVGMAFNGAVYYLATEDIFSMGWVSSLINYLVAPIPIRKQTTDVKAILNCIRVAKEGGTISIAPEGNRTYSGRTEYMNPSIVALARKLGMPIALFRIEGGYGVHPRWSDVIRRGRMKGYVARVIEPDEYAAMSDGELFEAISDGLYVDEARADGEYHHKKSAEYLERVIYVCPYCGLSEFESCADLIECKKCGRKIRYLPTKELAGVDIDFPFRYVAEWYDHQKDYINSIDIVSFDHSPIYEDCADLFEVIPCKKKRLVERSVKLKLYGTRIVAQRTDGVDEFPFRTTSAVTVLGRNKLNIYFDNRVYQIRGGKRFNALKYVHFYHRCKNIVKGEKNDKFLGL